MDSLQFDKAEFEDSRPKCLLCKSPIEDAYFHLSGQVVCPNCAKQAEAGQARPSNANVLKGLLYGVGAAIACAIAYAVITMVTNMEFAIASIAVGFLVGKAVRKGSQGLGGRRCQIIAVLLTYLAITTSYIPLISKSVSAEIVKTEEKMRASGDPAVANVKTGPATAVLAFGIIAFIALASPVLNLQEGIGGILGIAIIVFGLMQAWKQTGRHDLLITGPFTLGEASNPVVPNV